MELPAQQARMWKEAFPLTNCAELSTFQDVADVFNLFRTVSPNASILFRSLKIKKPK